MLGHINLSADMAAVIWPSVVNGLGISCIFVPLTTSTVAYLRQDQMGNATGLYNLMRNTGGSLGIAFVTTMIARDAQSSSGHAGVPHDAVRPGFREEPRDRQGGPGARTPTPSPPRCRRTA